MPAPTTMTRWRGPVVGGRPVLDDAKPVGADADSCTLPPASERRMLAGMAAHASLAEPTPRDRRATRTRRRGSTLRRAPRSRAAARAMPAMRNAYRDSGSALHAALRRGVGERAIGPRRRCSSNAALMPAADRTERRRRREDRARRRGRAHRDALRTRPRMRRRCAAKWPASMKSASTACARPCV